MRRSTSYRLLQLLRLMPPFAQYKVRPHARLGVSTRAPLTKGIYLLH